MSFTTDLWKSKATDGYMAITADYIDHCWTLRSTLFDFDVLEGAHTGQNISRKFHEIVDVRYNLSDKVLAIT